MSVNLPACRGTGLDPKVNAWHPTVPHSCMCGQQALTLVLPAFHVGSSCLTTSRSPPPALRRWCSDPVRASGKHVPGLVVCGSSGHPAPPALSVHQWARHQRQEGRTGDQLLTPRWPGTHGAEKLFSARVARGNLALEILSRERFLSDPQSVLVCFFLC